MTLNRDWRRVEFDCVTRAAALIIEDGRVALIERRRGAKVFYLFPGGQVEPDEIAQDAAVREAKEVLGLNVTVEQLIAEVTFEGTEQLYFLARAYGGRFGTGMGLEGRGERDERHSPVWLPCRGLSSNPVFPREVALLVEFSHIGWPHEVMRLTDYRNERPASFAGV